MSWFKALRRAGLAGGALCLALAVSACGFQPLYGRNDSGQRTQDLLAQVRIQPLPDRVGQQLHNLLRDRLNPRGQPREPTYNLQIRISETLEDLGIRKDETATRSNLTVFADFVLSETGTGQELFKGRSRSINSYNILDSQFATLFSESDARKRALREISDEIGNRLAVYFARIAGKSRS